MSQPKIKRTGIPTGTLPKMAINPQWITEGQPVARGSILVQSPDQKLSSGVWECSPGKFEWHYSWDEFAHIIEGEIDIREEGGDDYRLGPGDIVYFPCGLKTYWHVKKHVRKTFFLRTLEPLKL